MTAWERWELANFDAGNSRRGCQWRGTLSQRRNGRAAHGSGGTRTALRPRPAPRAMKPATRRASRSASATGMRRASGEAKAEAARIGQAADNLDQALRGTRPAGRRRAACPGRRNRPPGRAQGDCRPAGHDCSPVVSEALSYLPHQHAAIHLNPGRCHPDPILSRRQLTHSGHRILEDARHDTRRLPARIRRQPDRRDDRPRAGGASSRILAAIASLGSQRIDHVARSFRHHCDAGATFSSTAASNWPKSSPFRPAAD